MPLNVLISSAGRRVTLLRGFQEALEALRVTGHVFATDASPLAAAWHAADDRWIVPRCDDPQFIPTLLDICERRNVRVVIPTIDTELAALAEHRCEFAARGATVVVSSPETVHIAANKAETNRWLVAHAFPTVRQSTIADALRDPTSWPLPLIAKPANGSASIGVTRLDSWEQIHFLSNRHDYLVESVAPGVEHTVDVLVNRAGRAVCAVPRKRLEVRAGEVSKAVTVHDDEMEALARGIAERLPGAFGPLNIQMFAAPSGELSVVEINARFGGGFPLSARAGANFPRWILEDVLDLPESVDRRWRSGVGMLRYDAEVFFDAAEVGLTCPNA
jgi:carbamoyl-phosphate synthase large subunit